MLATPFQLTKSHRFRVTAVSLLTWICFLFVTLQPLMDTSGSLAAKCATVFCQHVANCANCLPKGAEMIMYCELRKVFFFPEDICFLLRTATLMRPVRGNRSSIVGSCKPNQSDDLKGTKSHLKQELWSRWYFPLSYLAGIPMARMQGLCVFRTCG